MFQQALSPGDNPFNEVMHLIILFPQQLSSCQHRLPILFLGTLSVRRRVWFLYQFLKAPAGIRFAHTRFPPGQETSLVVGHGID